MLTLGDWSNDLNSCAPLRLRRLHAEQSLYRLDLSASERNELAALGRELARRFRSLEEPTFLEHASELAQLLPLSLRLGLTKLKMPGIGPDVLIISGMPFDEQKLGKTPPHWRHIHVESSPTRQEELIFALIASFVGDVFGWATEQNGHLINDILPIEEHAHQQIGTGSLQEIEWHTEDSHFQVRPGYLALMCLRNPDWLPTTVATAAAVEKLAEWQRELLREKRYRIGSDLSHTGATESRHARIYFPALEAQKIAVLSGESAWPLLRIDRYFVERAHTDKLGRMALDALVERFDTDLWELVLEPGDICLIDNFRVVHGRRPFTPRYNGSDRWLKRLRIARNQTDTPRTNIKEGSPAAARHRR
ncbi:TauD/TfdA family dioxygenase [Gloeobacter morelensis]|uniref:TauD/TfdA family dioxygenase n=1 Tax=Gloeobacter morelensis MG652769 TaxID=2781736 RepID=A0ABY3PSW0_9CYAN|nr:TauD/TfdA family dioxygenase [Gloeobacter morelensis]UFP96549.1 TauD/TfdA family dioxygenase [Gloeobacter morelensis MG652769]